MIRGDYFQGSALFYTSFLWTISEMQIMLWKAKIFLHSCPCLSSLNFSSCRWIVEMEMGIQGWCWLFATRSSPLLTSFWKGDNRPHAWPFCSMIWSSCEPFYQILIPIDEYYTRFSSQAGCGCELEQQSRPHRLAPGLPGGEHTSGVCLSPTEGG